MSNYRAESVAPDEPTPVTVPGDGGPGRARRTRAGPSTSTPAAARLGADTTTGLTPTGLTPTASARATEPAPARRPFPLPPAGAPAQRRPCSFPSMPGLSRSSELGQTDRAQRAATRHHPLLEVPITSESPGAGHPRVPGPLSGKPSLPTASSPAQPSPGRTSRHGQRLHQLGVVNAGPATRRPSDRETENQKASSP
jgi:hypothetical protein